MSAPAPRPAPDGSELLFYDGDCGLCHRAVRFVVRVDRRGAFHFAPLGGETFRKTVSAERAGALPDSIVVCRADGALLSRGAAVRHVLRRLGGAYRVLAALLGLLPAPLLDRLYDAVAARRRRWFARPEASCPVVPPRLRARFEP